MEDDPELQYCIAHVVEEMKSNGTFDQIRRECQNEMETNVRLDWIVFVKTNFLFLN